MQDYPDILATDSVGGSRSNLLARDNAVKSCFAGTTYPSTGLLQGMLCYRTDLNKLYVMEQVSPAIWREVILTSAIGTAATKNVGTSGDTIPKNDTANTFSALQTFAAGVALANQSITGNSGAITIDADVRLNANSTKKLNFLINGTSAMTVETDRGVVIGGPTGGSKGAGTLNAVDIYKNGNQIKTAAYKDTGTSGDTIPTWNNLGNGAGLNLASNSEALAGAANDKLMTPLRVAEAIAAISGTADYQVFTATGTWNKPSGFNGNSRVLVQLWGGGGGGAGRALYSSNGGNGGASSFGSYGTAYGGTGGHSLNEIGGPGGGLFATASAGSSVNDTGVEGSPGVSQGGASLKASRFIGGGGGSGGANANGASAYSGGKSLYGGGGGAGSYQNGYGTGGASVFGGNGGSGNGGTGAAPGGGGGGQYASGNPGGSGGGGGSYVEFWMRLSDLASTVAVTVGAGGTAGTGAGAGARGEVRVTVFG